MRSALPERALWVDDQYATRCRGCDAPFTLLRRRHHCRHCGQIFCSDCLATTHTTTAGRIITDKIATMVGLRVDESHKICHECDRIVRKRRFVKRYIGQPAMIANETSLHHTDETSAPKLSESPPTPNPSEEHLDVAASSGEMMPTKLEATLSSSIDEKCNEKDENMMATTKLAPVPLESEQPPTEEIPTHPETPKEREISYSLAELPLYSRNSMTVWIERLRREAQGRKWDGAARPPKPLSNRCVFKAEPKAKFTVLEAAEGPTASIMATVFTAPVAQEELQKLEQEVSFHLIKRASRHFMSEEVLSSGGALDKVEWVAGLCDLAWRVVSQTLVVPREHVLAHLDVICVPGGSLSETKIIPGVAFLQTVAFRQMRTTVKLPRILLLAGDVGVAVKPLTDLTEYIGSCEGYLDKQYQRIKLWNPSVIVVEGRMHHYLLDRIQRESDITLVLQAGKAALHRLSRCCSASIIRDLQYVSGMDVSDPSALGTCDTFQLIQIGGKNICAFSGLRMPSFTTVLLRGGEGGQLDAAKRILVNCAITAYHLALQAHCFADFGIGMCPEYNPDGVAGDEEGREENRRLPSPCGNLAASNLHDHVECMTFISSSPRDEDLAATLSMNIAIKYPDDVTNMDPRYTKLVTDCLEVGTALLDTAAGDDPAGVTPMSSMISNVHQHFESFSFYSDADETLREYLTARAREGDGTRLIVHGNKRVWVTVKANASSGSRTNALGSRAFSGLGTTSQSLKLAQPCGSLQLGEKLENYSWTLPLRTEAICKHCMQDVTSNFNTAPMEPCSVHTLNISWGAFLEFLIYTSPSVVMTCGHRMCESSFLSFTLFPYSTAEVAVSIRVEELPVYDIIPPSMTMPLCADVVSMYYHHEFEELRQCVAQTIAIVQTALSPQMSQQVGMANQAKNAKQTFSQLLSSRNCITDADTTNVTEERGRSLLKQAEDLIGRLSSLQSTEGLTQVRCGEMAELIIDTQDWFAAYVALLERRGGKVSSLVDTLNLDCTSWALDMARSYCVRPDEPSSFLAVALRAIGIWSESSQDSFRSDLTPCRGYCPAPFADAYAEDIELTAIGEEVQKESMEKTVEFVLGVSPSNPTDASSPFAAICSVSDALEVLGEGVTKTKATFKHVVDCFYPWDKGETFRATVEVMFPTHFAALQYLYTEGKVDELMLSLSRCRAFKPQGGKTNSDFFITLDGRFLLKQIKQAELLHFAEFGPRYFTQLRKVYSRAIRSGVRVGSVPFGCSLGKVLGLFSLHVKGRKRLSDSSTEARFFVVMESVFYSRQPDVMYDLKGSQRNRVAREGSVVLLDQDLAKILCRGSFFFCSGETKNLFMDSITCDAHLLATSSIMDYSLIVGVDHTTRQLYVGIIDYLHPYTGAKAIESKVKAGLETVLGGQGRDPTIIDPPSYRERFTRWLGDCVFSVPTKRLAVPWVTGREGKSGDSCSLA